MEGYKGLKVWHKAMELVRMVYEVVRHFPLDERFALSDQLRRAAVSIPSNIAEGNGRSTGREYARFLSIARGSLFETLTQIQIAVDLGYIAPQPDLERLADEVGKMLTAMMKRYGVIGSVPNSYTYP